MSVSGDAAKRDVRAGRIERCLASGMSIGERCLLSKVSKSSLCKRLAAFCDEDPGRFAGKNSETSGWVKVACDGIAAAKAIVPAASAAGQAAADPVERTQGFRGRRSGSLSELSRPKRESSERFPVLRGCFDARRCFRGGRVRCCLGVCVARCERRYRAHACDQRERKGDRKHCGRRRFHGVASLMSCGGFATHGTVYRAIFAGDISQ